eukprot:6931039-Heterocapsa_arctica.AAC.1
MESNSNLERGNHAGKDRAHCVVPGYEAKSEETIGQIRSGQADERGGKEHYHNEKEGHEFLCDSD